jgi:hypothetical protein
MKNRHMGIGLALLLSAIVVLVFFGKSLDGLNNTYFSTGGDGFKAYYGALYHVQYDSLDYLNGAMNYPFGEISVFTDSQPPVANAIRFVSRNVADISGCTTGIINALMLLSFILGVLFVFLIFSELNVKWWYGALAATGICMLSPQIARMGGHFSLSWQIWIPAMVYFLVRYDRTRNAIYSLLIAVVIFLAGKMHPYFLGFFGFLVGGYWFWRFFRRKSDPFIWYRDVPVFFLQFLIPVFLVQLPILLFDEVTDRTAYPYGFSVYLGHPAGVFLPAGKPWLFVPEIIKIFNHLSWESLAYIGTSALAGLLVALTVFTGKKIKKQPVGKLSGSDSLNALFWVSVAALVFSFGVPFVFTSGWLTDLFGPVRQLRALGRFAWLFYYLLNILVFAALFHKTGNAKRHVFWKISAAAALLMLFYEGYWNMQTNTSDLHNRFPELEDHSNLTVANAWVKEINPADFQAILPLPYFHIGSENIWIDGSDESKKSAMLVSLKTGLPMTGAELSRTSISRSFINYSLVTEPLEQTDLPDFLENNKPLLVMKMQGYELTEAEKWLRKDARFLTETEKFTLLGLPVEHIKTLHESWLQNVKISYENSNRVPVNGFLVSGQSDFFRVNSFDHLPSLVTLRGDGAFSLPPREWVTLVEDTLKQVPGGKQMIAGFWVFNYMKDAYLRGNLEVVQKSSTTGETTGFDYTDFFRLLKGFDGDWALVEYEFETKSAGEILQIRVRNPVLPDAHYTIDELLIREKGLNVWKTDGEFLLCNGRRYKIR